MNEFLRNFIMTGIRDMIGKDVALYQTYQYASGWFNKNVLVQEDLEEIEKMYQSKVEKVEEVQDGNRMEGSEEDSQNYDIEIKESEA